MDSPTPRPSSIINGHETYSSNFGSTPTHTDWALCMEVTKVIDLVIPAKAYDMLFKIVLHMILSKREKQNGSRF